VTPFLFGPNAEQGITLTTTGGTSWMTGDVEQPALRLGFVPLLDCAPLIVAKERGLFARYGLQVELSREPSWANIRDKVTVGALDGAHMLAAIPLAATLGLGNALETPMVVPATLNLNGNAITVSTSLWEQMAQLHSGAAAQPGAALKCVVERRKLMGAPPLTFAVVFAYSSHNYLLRFWLATAGIDPDRDVRIVFVPPPLMAANLSARHVDGFCVGEPWNQRAVDLRLGRIVAHSTAIWSDHPEKVFGVTAAWAASRPNTLRATIAAIVEAARWMDEPDNRAEAARIMAQRGYIDAPVEVIAACMTGRPQFDPDQPAETHPDYILFHRHAANFPWRSHAEWTLAQMTRWGQIPAGIDHRAIADSVYRPDIYRDVAQALGVPSPTVDRKLEGAHRDPWILANASQPLVMGPDVMCDGRIFDSNNVEHAAPHRAAQPTTEPTGTERRATSNRMQHGGKE
jgi:two-component system, oxyanion-binding sensor